MHRQSIDAPRVVFRAGGEEERTVGGTVAMPTMVHRRGVGKGRVYRAVVGFREDRYVEPRPVPGPTGRPATLATPKRRYDDYGFLILRCGTQRSTQRAL